MTIKFSDILVFLRGRRVRLLLAAVPFLLVLSLIFQLAGRAAVNSPKPLSSLYVGLPGVPVELPPLAGQTGGQLEGKLLAASLLSDGSVLTEATTIRIPADTFRDSAFVHSMEILDPASGAVLFSRGPERLANHSDAVLIRRIDGPPLAGQTGPHEVSLRVMIQDGDRLALWTQAVPGGEQASPRDLTLVAGGTRGVVLGSWSTSAKVSHVSRWTLANYVWDNEFLPPWLICAGLLLLVCASALAAWGSQGRLCVTLLAAGVAFVYAFTFPPFQAPDEPDHFLTLTSRLHAENLANNTLELANRGHFESIKFRPDIHLSAEDIGKPLRSGWASHVRPTGEYEARSPAADLLWPALGRVIFSWKPANGLAFLRAFNVCIFALAFLVFVWLVPREFAFAGGLALLALPTLPFFAMHWSNHGMAISATIVVTGFAIRLAQRVETPPVLSVGWGMVAGVAVLSGAVGMTAFIVSVFVIPFAWFFSGLGFRRLALSSVAFAGGAGATLTILAPWSYFEAIASRLFGHAGAAVKTATPLVWFALTLCIAVMALLLWRGSRPTGLSRSRLANLLSRDGQLPPDHQWLKRFLNVESMAWLLFFLLPLPMIRWTIPGIESTDGPAVTGALAYGVRSVAAFFSGFGLGEPDFLATNSFWGGFGWLDAFPSDRFLRGVRLIPGLGICFVFLQAMRQRDFSSFVWLNMAGIVTAIVIFGLALGAHRIPSNLHGRYLVGVYVFFCSFCAMAGAAAMKKLPEGLAGNVRQVLFITVLALHVFCWKHLLIRYFG